MQRYTDKPWGEENLLAHDISHAVKHIRVSQGKRLSLQYHEHKTEIMILVKGRAEIQLSRSGRPQTMYRFVPITIRPHTAHRLIAVTDCVVVEVSSPELDDVVRLEDDFGRV